MPLYATLRRLDLHLENRQERPALSGWRRFVAEFWWFGIKEARACIFAGLFFLALFVVPRGLAGHRPLRPAPADRPGLAGMAAVAAH